MKKFLLSVLIMMGTAAVFAQVPGTVSYQGILVKTSPPADAGKPVDDGTHFVRFRFFNVPTGGTAVYSSTGTGSGNSVTTYKGMFSFIIGSGSAGNDPVPAGIFNEQLYVEIEADGVTLTPRVPLTTTPYTFRAQTANTATSLTTTLAIAGGGTGATTAAAARTNLGLGALATLGAVSSTEITDGTIVNADINASAAIAVTKLGAGTNGQVLTTTGGVPTWTTPSAGGSVTNVATGTGLTGGPITTTGTISIATGGVTTTLLGDNAVTSVKIVDGTVATADLADNSVTSVKIVDGTVATADLADNSVTAAKIVDGTIANADINATAGIAVTKLASGTNGQVLTTSGGVPTWTTPSAGGTVTSVGSGTGLTGGPITTTGTLAIATGGVTTALLADNSVNSAKIIDGSIATADIADGAITAAKIAAGATLSGSGVTNRLAFWSGTSALSSNANLFWDNTTSRFGIGTTTPAFPIDVTLSAGASTAKFGATRGICLVANSPMVGFNIYWGSGYTYHSAASGGIITWSQEVPDGFSFNTAPSGAAGAAATLTSRMSILNNGNVGIGTTTPATRLDVAGGINATGNIQTGGYFYFSSASGKYIFNVSGSYTGLNDHFIPNNSNTYDLGTTSWRWRTLYTNTSPNVSSDYRLKKEIHSLSYGLTEVLSLRPVTYVLKDDTQGSTHLGLIAQEVKSIIPEIVIEEKTGEKLLGLTYTELIPVLINAIKEQQALIATQGSTLADMKAELAELRKMVMAQQPKEVTTTTASVGKE